MITRRNSTAATVVAFALGASVATAEGYESALVDALTEGQVKFDMRFRWENAQIDGLRTSHAETLRTRLGYGSRPYYGFSGYAEFENILSVDDNSYFDAIAPNTRGRTVIADPEETELNQAYGKWSSDGLSGEGVIAQSKTSLMGGRQRIVLDDARFVGNVGWRQNEQTYDAAVLQSAFGIEGLSTTWGYIFDVKRIFGNDGGAGAGTRDFNSDSYILNATWSGFEPISISVYGYLLDFSNSPANSSDTYGFRVTGKHDIGEKWWVGYTAAYAHQQDAADNPANYGANYYNVEGVIGWDTIGSLTLGYEVLGSDGGSAQFRTPLATAHKFNGWADAFLVNGGAVGLEDLYVSVSPKLPFGLKGKLVYHHFRSDRGGVDYGDEIDGVLSKKFFEHLTLLAKFAYYDGGGPRPDRHRFWMQTVLAF